MRDEPLPPGFPKPRAAKKKAARSKKPTQSQLVRKADELFSLIVRRPGFCFICGDTFRLQCAHGFSRRYRTTRWALDNAWCLCSGCHTYYTHRPHEWEHWMQQQLGLRGYRSLQGRALAVGAKVDVAAVLEALEAA